MESENFLSILARPSRLERLASTFGGLHSIQLSYERIENGAQGEI